MNNKKKPNLISDELNNNLQHSVFAKKVEFPKSIESVPKEHTPDIEQDVLTNNTDVAPQLGTTAPHTDIVAPQVQGHEFHIDVAKLRTIVEEISQIETKRDGLNVRLSDQESQDLEDFIHDKLRRSGLKGYDVSAAKLMRYAFRYISRVHEKEFIKALSMALKSESNLSI